MKRDHKQAIPLHQLAATDLGVEVFPVTNAASLSPFRQEAVIPHRHDHYSCFLVEQGQLEMMVDFQPVRLSPATLLVSHPGQIHQLGTVQDFQGWVLLTKASWLHAHLRDAIEQSHTNVCLLQLTKAQYAWFNHLLNALYESADTQSPPLVRTEVIPSLLNAWLGQVTALVDVQQQLTPAPQLRSIGLTKQFRQLLHQHVFSCKKPADYADKLNLTVSYLNDTVKAVTGFSLSYFIQQELLAEAQRLLLYSPLSVKEIAARLGYEDPKYFMRVFRKGKGLSPNRFQAQALARQRQADQAGYGPLFQ